MQAETESNRSEANVLSPSVAIVGGGLAGIAAAFEASKRGARVVLFERKRRLGGRAASINFGVPGAATADAGSRAFFGRSFSLRRFHSELGLDDCFDSFDSVPFVSLDSKKPFESSQIWDLATSACVSTKKSIFADLAALAKFGPLSFNDRRNLVAVCREIGDAAQNGIVQNAPSQTFAELLRNLGATEKTIDAFWRPLVLSATAELPEIVAARAAINVFGDAFAQGKSGATALFPNRPLGEIYHRRTFAALQKRGIDVRFLSRVERFETTTSVETGKREVVGLWNAGKFEKFDKIVLAVDPFEAFDALERSELSEVADSIRISQYEYGAITAVHFWLDRPLTESRVVVLSGEPAQRLFRSPSAEPETFPTADSSAPTAFYFQAQIAASHRLLSDEEIAERGKNALIDRVWRQLSAGFPQTAAGARILAARTSTALDAVISPSPVFWTSRPAQKTACANLALAGDWTETALPSSMEGAVLSGVRAAQTIFS